MVGEHDLGTIDAARVEAIRQSMPYLVDRVLGEAADSDGRPTLVVTRTHIGFGAPTKQDTSAAHGSPLGAEEVAGAKRAYGWPEDATFLVPDEVTAWAPRLQAAGREAEAAWDAALEAYAAAHPAEAAVLGLGDAHERLLRHRLQELTERTWNPLKCTNSFSQQPIGQAAESLSFHGPWKQCSAVRKAAIYVDHRSCEAG